MEIEPIAHIESPYLAKFGVPRQPGLAPSCISKIVFDAEVDAISGEEGVIPGDILIVMWGFSHNVADASRWSKTIRPPLLGGTQRIGVFASRSSYRPNNLALSCVEVVGVDEGVISFRGGDMVDGTPVFAAYPYDEDGHSRPEASEGWRSQTSWPQMERIVIPSRLRDAIPLALRDGLMELLRQDPRPAYTRKGQEDRSFWVPYGDAIIWFSVIDRILVVRDVTLMDEEQIAHVKATGALPDLPKGSDPFGK